MGLAGQGRAANLRHFSAFGRGAQWGFSSGTAEIWEDTWIYLGPTRSGEEHIVLSVGRVCVYIYNYMYILYNYIQYIIYIIIYSGTTYFIGLPSLLIGATWSN